METTDARITLDVRGHVAVLGINRPDKRNAMRWLLTGDEFDAREAHRIGLVQEVVPPGQQKERALALAETVAKQAPLGVRATLASARQTLTEGPAAAARSLLPTLIGLSHTEDAREGVRSFVERREARFTGR